MSNVLLSLHAVPKEDQLELSEIEPLGRMLYERPTAITNPPIAPIRNIIAKAVSEVLSIEKRK
jgi:hypothetical protein